jgi:hypothetical protein
VDKLSGINMTDDYCVVIHILMSYNTY